MESLFHYLTTPGRCGYLPEQCWRLEYEIVGTLSPGEYMERLLQGWRRFGVSLFRPRCSACNACRSIRVLADRFRPDRSARRLRQANEGVIRLEIGAPSVSQDKLDLFDRYHAQQAERKGWPRHEPKDVEGYVSSYVENPIPTQEWCYYLGSRLAGVGYVDELPGGMSAIYFYYDPNLRDRSLGTWNILCLLERAAQREVPHLYLGYYVEGCPSMVYKARFVPNQILGPDGRWRDFRG